MLPVLPFLLLLLLASPAAGLGVTGKCPAGPRGAGGRSRSAWIRLGAREGRELLRELLRELPEPPPGCGAAGECDLAPSISSNSTSRPGRPPSPAFPRKERLSGQVEKGWGGFALSEHIVLVVFRGESPGAW